MLKRRERTIWPIADLQRWDTQPGDTVSVPEAHSGCQKDSLVGRHLVDNFINICLCKV